MRTARHTLGVPPHPTDSAASATGWTHYHCVILGNLYLGGGLTQANWVLVPLWFHWVSPAVIRNFCRYCHHHHRWFHIVHLPISVNLIPHQSRRCLPHLIPSLQELRLWHGIHDWERCHYHRYLCHFCHCRLSSHPASWTEIIEAESHLLIIYCHCSSIPW